MPYSEGNTDDLNKVVWSARGWNSSRSGEEIARDYARWFFGELTHFSERQRACLEALSPAGRCRAAVRGIPLVEHIQEFLWESGAPAFNLQ